MNTEIEKSAEIAESVDLKETTPQSKPEKTTETTKTAESSDPQKAAQEPAPQWPPKELEDYSGPTQTGLRLTSLFLPKKQLIPLLVAEIQRDRSDTKGAEAKAVAERIFSAAQEYLKAYAEENLWAHRLICIHGGEYPKELREIWCNGKISGFRYEKITTAPEIPYTFRTKQVEPISHPKDLLCSNIAPDLFLIEQDGKGKLKAVPTPDVERFSNSDKKIVPRSALHEEVIYNRPTYGIKSGWEPYSPKRLPRKVVTVELLCKEASHSLIQEFIDDLKATFAWPESKNDDQYYLAVYLGYLIQPMLAHLYQGQMPAYAFLGPTKAGKGFLSNALPALIYNREGEATVMIKKLPKETYEFEVLMETAKNCIYLCFDEAKNASDEELKVIDAFCTQTDVQVRKFRVGYYQLPNLYTVSLTAVHRTFTDESYGRLAVIQLKESRPELISQFYQKWKHRGPELLRAMYNAINDVVIDFNNLPKVPDRRPGFSLMAYMVEKAFGMRPDYAIDTANNDILDDLCTMHEGTMKKTMRGNWAVYSPRNFTNYMAEHHDIKWKKSNAVAAINTALGYTSTRRHPTYKDAGYPAESGRRYHIEIREEGQVNKRTQIYIQDIDGIAFSNGIILHKEGDKSWA